MALNGFKWLYLITIALPIANIWRVCEEEFWRWGLRLIWGVWGMGGICKNKKRHTFSDMTCRNKSVYI